MSELPVIGITMGDPAGIGPEIIVKALGDPAVRSVCRPVVLGDAGVLSRAAVGAARSMAVQVVSAPEEAGEGFDILYAMDLSALGPASAVPGRPTVEGGQAMIRYISHAVEMALQGRVSAMVTCPISKVLLRQSGCSDEGHTQMIARLTATQNFVMMLAGKRLRVSLVTLHRPLRSVAACLSTEQIYRTIAVTEHSLRQDFDVSRPRLAVAALNPHGGEAGLFGWEEEEIIQPAVERARAGHIRVEGPFPADTLFHRAAGGRFDAVVAMYHDQGLIPLKLLHFSDAVNITLGLPIIRTSVDHGTAYDISGTGRADPSSLKSAVVMAADMAENRRKSGTENSRYERPRG